MHIYVLCIGIYYWAIAKVFKQFFLFFFLFFHLNTVSFKCISRKIFDKVDHEFSEALNTCLLLLPFLNSMVTLIIIIYFVLLFYLSFVFLFLLCIVVFIERFCMIRWPFITCTIYPRFFLSIIMIIMTRIRTCVLLTHLLICSNLLLCDWEIFRFFFGDKCST